MACSMMRTDRGISTMRKTMLRMINMKVVLLVLFTLLLVASRPDWICWAFLRAFSRNPLNIVTRMQGKHWTKTTLNQKKMLKYRLGVMYSTQVLSLTTHTGPESATFQQSELLWRQGRYYLPMRKGSLNWTASSFCYLWHELCRSCHRSWWRRGRRRWELPWWFPGLTSALCTIAWWGRAYKYRYISGLTDLTKSRVYFRIKWGSTPTQSQPVGCGVTEVGNHLTQQLDQVADSPVQEIQGVVAQGKYVEMSAQRKRSDRSFNEKIYKGACDNRLARSKNAMAARMVLVALLMVGLQANYF